MGRWHWQHAATLRSVACIPLRRLRKKYHRLSGSLKDDYGCYHRVRKPATASNTSYRMYPNAGKLRQIVGAVVTCQSATQYRSTARVLALHLLWLDRRTVHFGTVLGTKKEISGYGARFSKFFHSAELWTGYCQEEVLLKSAYRKPTSLFLKLLSQSLSLCCATWCPPRERRTR